MSMADAARDLRKKLGEIPWFAGKQEEPIKKIVRISAIDDISELIRMANERGVIDPFSSTWMGVRGWAAQELLENFAKQEKADDDKSAELRVRAKVLREVMMIASPKTKPKFE
jgi:hypothetical protein